MKKLLFVGILIILTFTTCTKNLGVDETFALKQRVPESMLSLIKAWHEKKIAVNETLLNLSKTSTTNQSRKATLIPDYEHATFETLPSGATLTTVPADDFTFVNSKVGFFRTFVFLNAQNKVMDGKIIELYGDPKTLIRIENILSPITIVRLLKVLRGRFSHMICTIDL